MPAELKINNLNADTGSAFTAAVLDFNPVFLNSKSCAEIMFAGLEVYSKLPGCIFAAAFMLNQEEFTFEMAGKIGEMDETAVTQEFNILVDRGVVAEVLGTVNIVEWNPGESGRNWFVIIPLTVIEGIIGLVVLKVFDYNRNEEYLSLCRIQANYFSQLLNEQKLKVELNRLKETADRKLETRTEEIIQSTRELKSILDSVLTGIIMVDKNTNEIIDANVAAAALIGEQKENIIGSNRSKYFLTAPKSYQKEKASRSNIPALGTEQEELIADLEGLMKRADGTLVPIIRNTSTIKFGGDDCILESFVDISSRKKMEEDLQRAHFELERRVEERTMQLAEANDELLRQIDERIKTEEEKVKLYLAVQQSPSSIMITDLNAVIEYVNPKFTSITGYEFDEVIGQRPSIIKSDELGTAEYEDLWRTIKSGREWRKEFRNRKKNGELYWVSATILPIRNLHGEITNYLGVEEDITDKKNFETQIIAAKTKAEESDRLKSSLLANMSHEFRTPLIGILGFSQFLHAELQEQEYLDMLNDINISGKRLLNTLDGVLQLAQMESTSTYKQNIRVNIADDLMKAFLPFNSMAKAKGLKFSVKVINKQLCVILDSDLFTKAVNSLIDNAIKYTEEGSIEVVADRRTENDETWVVVEVKDSGIGISPENQEIIFEAFRQASEGYARSYEGCGLGLTLAKKMIELMDGKLTVESQVSKGSTFTIWLPVCDR